MNNERIEARRNLCDAFKEVRDHNNTICLWADALCINQADDIEKTHQVGLMRDIYQIADDVVIWIGYPTKFHSCGSWHVCSAEVPDTLQVEEVNRAWDMVREHFHKEPEARVRLIGSPIHSTRDDLPVRLVADSESADEQIYSDIEAKTAKVFGRAIRDGLLPGNLYEFLPETLPRTIRKEMALWLQSYYLGTTRRAFECPDDETVAVFEKIRARIERIQKFEDCLLRTRTNDAGRHGRLDWNHSNSALACFFEGAYENATLPPAFHVIAALALLQMLSSGLHAHEYLFFSRQSDNIEFYPSLLWIYAAQHLKWILTNPYWTRIWILQEVALAKSPKVLYGDHWVPFRVFARMSVDFRKHYYGCCKHLIRAESGSYLRSRWWSHFKDAARELETLSGFCTHRTLLTRTYLEDLVFPRLMFRHGSDRRDYIYSVLGLVRLGRGSLIKPDYTKSTKTVFIQATMAIIEDQKNLWALSLNEETEKLSCMNLPSWTPNWSFNGTEPLYLASARRKDGTFSVGQNVFDASAGLPFFARLVDGSILEVKSACVDSVRHVSTAASSQNLRNARGNLDGEQIWNTLQQWQRDAGGNSVTFRFTLLAGSIDDGQRSRRLVLEEVDDVDKSLHWLHKSETERGRDISPDVTRCLRRIEDKQMFKTKSGRLGLGNATYGNEVQAGDEIHVVAGSSRLLILRPIADFSAENSKETGMGSRGIERRHYRLHSTCYIKDWMDGEAAEGLSMKSIFLI